MMKRLEFRTRFIKRLCDKAGKEGKVEEWMCQAEQDAWESYIEPSSSMSPEDMADEELDNQIAEHDPGIS